MQVKCLTELDINIVNYTNIAYKLSVHRTKQKVCSWVNGVFKIPGCVQKHFATFVPRRQGNAWYVGYG